MKLLPKDPVKTLIKIAYLLIAGAFVFLLLPRLIKYFLPILCAIVISVIIDPVVGFLVKKVHFNRRISVIIAMLLVITLLGAIIFNLVYQAVYFLQDFAEKIPDLLDREYVFLDWLGSLNAFMIKMPESMRSFVENIRVNVVENLSQLIAPATKTAINAAGSIASALPSMLIFTVVLILATYFISYDREKIVKSLVKHVKPKRFERIKLIKNKLFQVCGAYFRAQLIMMGIIFCVLLIGFSILGIESPFFVAFITAIVDAVPVLGTGTVLVPWAIFELISGKYTMALGLIIIYILAIVVRQFTEPRVVSAQIGLHPLVTITSMYVGLKAIGIFGMIVGPVVTIIVLKSLEIERNLESENNIADEGSN
ncbi:MAG: sporulation integral membrane protein YtvI [Clostridia bacterium]|nr:sporulation integral membrane protein YtvI [Clostridia bacterium]